MLIDKRQDSLVQLGNSLQGASGGPRVKCGPVIPSHCGGHVSPGKSKNSVPAVKNHIVLDSGLNVEDESKIPIRNRTHVFWQTSINDQ